MNGSAQRTLITGATGFVGSHLTAALIEKLGTESVIALVRRSQDAREQRSFERLQRAGVKILECDLLELPKLKLDPPEFDVVYHLAAFAETETAGDHFRVNSDGTRNLLRWLAPQLVGKRVVYTGTLASHDRDRPTTPADESSPTTPRTEYGRSKLQGEEFVRAAAREFGFDYTILRLCTIIGRGYRPGGMFGACPALLEGGRWATRLNWPGRVSFLGVRDLIQILLAAPVTEGTANELFVVSNGEDPTFDALLDQMAQVLGLKRDRIVLPKLFWRVAGAIAWPMASMRFIPHRLRNQCWRAAHIIYDGIRADGSKLKKLLGIQYQTVLDALRETYGPTETRDQRPETTDF
jgi:nucleoside-diphosphate-sugar epimerase